ncbi:MAG: hypothetical protein HGB01_12420 [Chlorobiaceae bacterium]|nr:hypothetical protein [Chlorobiaceae bacterium]
MTADTKEKDMTGDSGSEEPISGTERSSWYGFGRLPLFMGRNLDFSIFLSIFKVFRRQICTWQ